VVDLIEEYKAAERPDYVTWGIGGGGNTTGNGSGPMPMMTEDGREVY